MVDITLRQFGGISPRTPARYLGETQAQVAVNCPTWLGSLAPIPDTLQVASFSKAGAINSIYRFGQDFGSKTQYWFHWTEEVDVVRGAINGDVTERTFYTGVGAPKATDNALALTGAGTNYPLAYYMLGVPQPTVGPTAVAQGTATPGSTPERRVYTYTLVNSWGEESAPVTDPGPTATVDVSDGQTVDITFPAAPSGNYSPQYRRLYRAVDGVFLLVYINGVADIPVATGSVTDSATADELGEEMPSLTWLPPPSDMAGLVGLPNGLLAGFSGIDVCFCEPYRPFAWPVQYRQSVGYDIVGLGVIDTTTVALTNGKPFFIQGSHPDSMVVVEADVSQACVSKQSIVSVAGSVFYASPDGLVRLSPNGSDVVTATRYDKKQWQQLKPESIRAFQYELKYIAFYDTGTVQGGFIYDIVSGELTTHSMYATGGYNDLKADTLFLIVDNTLHEWEAGASLSYTWKSKKFTYPRPVGFACFRVRAETYPINFTLYKDGVAHYATSVTDGGVRRLPSGLGTTYEIELSGTGEVYEVKVASSMGAIDG